MTLHAASILTLEDYMESRLWLSDILAIVCREYHTPLHELMTPSRNRKLSRARHAFFYLAKKLAKKSYAQASVKLPRSKETVRYGYRKVVKQTHFFEPELSRCISELQRKSIPEPQPAASPHPLAVAATGAVPQEASAPVAPPISRVLP